MGASVRRPALFLLLATLAWAAPARAAEDRPSGPPIMDNEDRKTIYRALERSETLGFMLSATIGFGAGSFYAGENGTGTAFLAAELGLGVLSYTVLASTAPEGDTSGVLSKALGSGTALVYFHLALRIADAIAAVNSVSSFNDEIDQTFRIGALRRKLSFAPTIDPVTGSYGAKVALRF